MNKKLPAAVMLLSMLPYATAGTSAIGTASARGDMRVDGYSVKGDATLFNGSVVESGQASVALRLSKGGEAKLATDSRGAFYSDRMVLQHGSTEWTPASNYAVNADGLLVAPDAPHSRGVVSVSKANTVEVAALTGGFRVSDSRGLLLAHVTPGHALSFGSLQAATEGSYQVTATGAFTESAGHYYLKTTDTGMLYEVQGSNLQNLVGKTVTVSGTLDPNIQPAGGASSVITASGTSAQTPAAQGSSSQAPQPAATQGGLSNRKKLIIGGIIVGGATGLALGLYEANESSTPASR